MKPVILDVQGYELDSEEKEILTHPLVAGVILFTRNYHDLKQLKALVKAIRRYAKNELIIAVDHEGGRVQRFREGFTRLPSAGSLIENNDLKTACELAFSSAWIMASELIACDIDLSFAPVLDLNGISDVIQNRAFSSSITETVTIAEAYINGMRAAGMASTGKHFPGHGSVKADSHKALAVDSRSELEIFTNDIKPFETLIKKGALDAVMPSHVVYSQCDLQPAGFSSYWLSDVLRTRLAFKGVVISDDLSMHGASFAGDHLSRAEMAIQAGCDLILACNDRPGAVSILDNLKVKQTAEYHAVNQLRCLKNKFTLPLNKNPIWIKNQQMLMPLSEQF
ncbi:MAG: beta-N-acetylhexosaminidase [Psychromonas sp.]|jgi:beta-N-acetylhexosaminidase|uniref:beta-N-acetylhexosaminidase n=1 Tax=Psychromonas sp. TaxID=1884585 RepID=UPI0039E5AABB